MVVLGILPTYLKEMNTMNKNNKSVHKIVDEYNNRQNAPKYSMIRVIDYKGSFTRYYTVTNLKNISDSVGTWLEFDTVQHRVNTHIRVLGGKVEQYNEPLPDELQTRNTIPDCIYVDIYTVSGDVDRVEDVQNLYEDLDSLMIEYDKIVEGQKMHIKMSGFVEKSVERVHDTNNITR